MMKFLNPLFLLFLCACSFPLHVDYGIAPNIAFSKPVKCKYGVDCFIEKYFDHGKGNTYFEQGCGVRTEDGYKGTLFRIRQSKMIKDDIAVLAVADAVVERICNNPNKEDKNCPANIMEELGNHIVLDHRNGWKTYYGFLKDDSIKVDIGQKVAKSQKIAYVGQNKKDLSPVLDFRASINNNYVDPFVGTVDFPNCRYSVAPLWEENIYKYYRYKDINLINGAFLAKEPSFENISSGDDELQNFDKDEINKLYFAVEVLGVRKGDIEKIEILSPNNELLYKHEKKLAENELRHIDKAMIFKPSAGWYNGEYKAYYTLFRAGQYGVVFEVDITAK